MYRLVVAANGNRLRYGEKGGGSYTNLASAIGARDFHRKLGRTANILVTECDWKEYE